MKANLPALKAVASAASTFRSNSSPLPMSVVCPSRENVLHVLALALNIGQQRLPGLVHPLRTQMKLYFMAGIEGNPEESGELGSTKRTPVSP
jgi:hypothetical protein